MKRNYVLSLFILLFSHYTSQAAQIAENFHFEEEMPWDDFNPSNIGTIKGNVSEIISKARSTGIGDSLIALFNSKFGKILVLLGPEWFLKNQNIKIKNNDYLIIKGSKIESEKEIILIATELTINDKKIKLRDNKTGLPEWNEWRKGDEFFYRSYKW